MKIFTDNAVYVQKNDIDYLGQTYLEIPVPKKNFDSIVDDSNRYEFVEFNAPEEIQFFREMDCIIDYNEVKDLSEEEIIKLTESVGKEHETIVTRYNSLPVEERKKDYKIITQCCDLLEFKFYSLRDFLWFKQGDLKMKLPEEVDSLTELKEEKENKELSNTMFNNSKN